MDVKIQNLSEVKIKGVSYCMERMCEPYKETYFNWVAYPMVNELGTSEIVCGHLTAWHHALEFDQVEIHKGREVFFFTEGECVMIFCDLEEGEPVMESIQIVRIQPGTEICVEAGKAHFVPIPVGDRLQAVVTAPEQDAPRIPFPEIVRAVV